MHPATQMQSPAPFLSAAIICRPSCCEELAELLTCLAAQNCDDFEVAVVAPEGEAADVKGAVHLTPRLLQERTRVFEAGDGLLDHVLSQLWGQYVSLVSVDALLADNWVSTLRRAAWEQPGAVVRCFASRQTWKRIDAPLLEAKALISVSPIESAHCAWLDSAAPMQRGPIPPASWAFPLFAVRDFNLQAGIDANRPDYCSLFADAIALCGLQQIPETAVLQRVWTEAPIEPIYQERHDSRVRDKIPPEIMEPLRRLRRL